MYSVQIEQKHELLSKKLLSKIIIIYHLYTHVRPRMEYASSVWDTGHVALAHMLETEQSRAARFVLADYHRSAGVTH